MIDLREGLVDEGERVVGEDTSEVKQGVPKAAPFGHLSIRFLSKAGMYSRDTGVRNHVSGPIPQFSQLLSLVSRSLPENKKSGSHSYRILSVAILIHSLMRSLPFVGATTFVIVIRNTRPHILLPAGEENSFFPIRFRVEWIVNYVALSLSLFPSTVLLIFALHFLLSPHCSIAPA